MVPADSPTFRLVSPLNEPDWDSAVARLPGVTFFHSAAWARVLFSAYGFELRYLVRNARGAYHTVLPLAEVNSWLTGRRGVSLPFSDLCGPLTCEADTIPRLLDALSEYGHRQRWKYWEIRGGCEHFPGGHASVSFWGHSLPLIADFPALLARFEPAHRRAIRKAEKSNVTAEFSRGIDAVRAFHQLLCLTRRRHGLPPQPFSFFAAIHQEVLEKKLGVVVLARHGSVPIAGAIFFESFGGATYKFGASDEAYQHLRGNNLVMARAIEHFAQRKFSSLDFGRTSLGNSGLRQFKLGWGANEHRIDYARYDLQKDCYVTTPDQSHGWHTRVFQRLPGIVSRALGVALYRHIA
jgi:hypothetical protein